VDPVRNAIAARASCADLLAATLLGFAVGVCVNAGAAPELKWLLTAVFWQ